MTANLESFICLWLDQAVNTSKTNVEFQQQLRQIINDLQIFENSQRCEDYIRKITDEKIVLIVSGSLGRQIVPRLHDLSQFSACYVFCQDEKANKEWAEKYPKVSSHHSSDLFDFLLLLRFVVFSSIVLLFSNRLLKIRSIVSRLKKVFPFLSLVRHLKIFKRVMQVSCGFSCSSKFFFVCITKQVIEKN